jgi:hypothetical protein
MNRSRLPRIASFTQAEEYLSSGRNANYRKIPGLRSTILRRDVVRPLRISLYYHDTAVIQWYRDGRIILDSGGYRTITTKRRLNQFANVNIYQRSFTWYMADGSEFHDLVNIGILEVIPPHEFTKTNSLF